VSILNFFEVIKNRRSIRKYQDKNVEREKLQKILEAARIAPSAMNRQPYQLFVVINQDILSKIESACNQQWKAPIMIAVVCVPKEAWVRDDGEEFWKADAAIMMNQVSLAAFAEGLGTCWIAAFKENEVKEILGVDSASRIPFLSPLGYPAENKGPITNRKTIDSLVRYV
jgi:nitroreductase